MEVAARVRMRKQRLVQATSKGERRLGDRGTGEQRAQGVLALLRGGRQRLGSQGGRLRRGDVTLRCAEHADPDQPRQQDERHPAKTHGRLRGAQHHLLLSSSPHVKGTRCTTRATVVSTTSSGPSCASRLSATRASRGVSLYTSHASPRPRVSGVSN